VGIGVVDDARDLLGDRELKLARIEDVRPPGRVATVGGQGLLEIGLPNASHPPGHSDEESRRGIDLGVGESFDVEMGADEIGDALRRLLVEVDVLPNRPHLESNRPLD
jgi:hypothetical protein